MTPASQNKAAAKALKIGVLISGRGSNLRALMKSLPAHDGLAEIACVISNNGDAGGLLSAREAGIPAVTIDHRDFASKLAFETELTNTFEQHGVQLVCLAGFMRLLSPAFVDAWRDRLINIHPSLLPAFPGLDTHKKALTEGVRFAGCTVHFVRAEMDHGPIIAQASVPVLPDDTEESLAARILIAEHKLYPDVVRYIAEGRVNVMDEKVFIAGAEAVASAAYNPVSVKGSTLGTAQSFTNQLSDEIVPEDDLARPTL